jgi:hypothetical protein
MTAYVVRLYTEQAAEVTVQADPADATQARLRELALQALDQSGGAEWETTYAETQCWPSDERTGVGRLLPCSCSPMERCTSCQPT